MKSEVWKDIFGYEGFYQVSNKGNVRSLERKVASSRGKVAIKKGVVLKPRLIKRYLKYRAVTLFKYNSGKSFQVHRLVAIAFIANPNNRLVVNHKDNNPGNNNVDNLEWVTYSENSKYSFTHGRQAQKGENHPTAKLSNANVREIRELFATGKYKKSILSKEFNVTWSNINNILQRRIWKHID